MSVWSWLGSNGLGLLNSAIGLGTSLFNLSEQRKANDANIGLTREQMQWASDEAQKERDWEKPANQLQLMRDAGLNPITYSSPVSQTSPPSAPSSPAQQPVKFDSDILSQFLTGLQVDSLREDVKAKKLANKDKQLELNAKVRALPDPENNWHYDDEGNIVMEVTPEVTGYDEERRFKRNEIRKQKEDIEGKKVSNQRAKRDLDLFNDLFDTFKDSNIYQLLSLKEDVVNKKLNNDLLSDKVYMLNTYGITSDDKNSITALLRAALRSPDNLSNVIDAIVAAMRKTGSHIAEDVGQVVQDMLSGKIDKGSW